MKKILTLLLIIPFFSKVKAQSTLCPSLNSFVGEWRYVNGQDTIRVYLRASDYIINVDSFSNETVPKLWGWHEYKQGNTVLESNYGNRFMSLPSNSANNTDNISRSYSISLQMFNCDPSKYKLKGNINDITQCYESMDVKVHYNGAFNQITWHQEHSEGYGFMTGCKGMTLPKDFVLSKQ